MSALFAFADTSGAAETSVTGPAPALGSPGSIAHPAVAIASDPTGNGYWLVSTDGGVFTFGSARFAGAAAGQPLSGPIVDIAPTPDGGGYWLAGSDGSVLPFGDADLVGSLAGGSLPTPCGRAHTLNRRRGLLAAHRRRRRVHVRLREVLRVAAGHRRQRRVPSTSWRGRRVTATGSSTMRAACTCSAAHPTPARCSRRTWHRRARSSGARRRRRAAGTGSRALPVGCTRSATQRTSPCLPSRRGNTSWGSPLRSAARGTGSAASDGLVAALPGDQGDNVRAIQDRLTKLGYWMGPLDGRTGSLMSQAVMAFQK